MSNLVAISDARANLPELVNKVSDNLDRFVITVNGQPKAVLVSEEELESLEETAEILAIPGAKEAIDRGVEQAKKGEVRPLEDILNDIA
jgi:antitoxin YefM